MNRDDIIRMADQSEIDPYDMCEDHRIGVHRLMAFAALVAAAEREACAKVCDEQSMRSETSMKKSKTVKARDIYSAAGLTARWMSAAIRARGETK